MAAKANATLPSGKGIKAPAVPPVSRVSESSSSDSSEHDVLAGEVVTEETEVGSFPGESGQMGVLEYEAGAVSPAGGVCSWRGGRGGLLYFNHCYCTIRWQMSRG